MKHIDRAPWVGRFLVTLAVLSVAVSIVACTYAYLQRASLWHRAEVRNTAAVALVRRTVEGALRHIHGDVAMLARSARVRSYLGQPDAAARGPIEQVLLRLARVRGNYASVELLDAGGHARIRVVADDGAFRALQVSTGSTRPQDRRALAALVHMKPRQLYMAPLASRSGAVPDVRIGEGVYADDGTLLGAVLVRADGRLLMSELGGEVQLADGPMWLVGEEGRWPLTTRRPESSPLQLDRNRPDLWQHVLEDPYGQFRGDYGLLTFAGVSPSGATADDAARLHVVSLARDVDHDWMGLQRFWWLYVLGFSLMALIAAWIVRQQTQLAEARRRTEANSRLLNDIFLHSPLMMKVKDLDRKILRVNEAGTRMIGRPIDELRGRTIRNFATPETADLIASHDDEVISGNRVSQYEEKVDYVGGSYTLLTTRFPVTDASGRVTGVGAVSADITERKHVEESLQLAKVQAESANRAKSAFLANMSHELRTPLNSIIGLSELLMEDLREARLDQHTEPLRRVIQAGRHLLYLINDLLDLARVESGRIELTMEPCLVQEVVDVVESSISPLTAANGNQLTVNVAPDVQWVHADPHRLKQVLINLLGNAAKFTRRGHVHLNVRMVRHPEARVEFVVNDDGIGIAPGQLAHIFEPFHQGDVRAGSRYGGTGLGLAITRQLVDLMGGEISVDSVLDKGSTFTVCLPAARSSVGVTVSSKNMDSSTSARSDDGSPLVIVVDDDADAREVVAATLERDGVRVLTAATGADALELTTHHDPDLLVLDIGLPDMSGWDVLARLRADPDHDQLPVILCTISDVDKRMLSLGVAEHFAKPVDRERLRAVVRRLTGHAEHAVVGIVDDDADYRRVLSETLHRAGYDVIEASTGPAIIELLRHRHCDLLLLDVVLPGMDGVEVVERLRGDPATADIEVVLITAADLDQRMVESIHGRALTLVRKQTGSPEAIAARVRDTLHKLREGATATTEQGGVT